VLASGAATNPPPRDSASGGVVECHRQGATRPAGKELYLGVMGVGRFRTKQKWRAVIF